MRRALRLAAVVVGLAAFGYAYARYTKGVAALAKLPPSDEWASMDTDARKRAMQSAGVEAQDFQGLYYRVFDIAVIGVALLVFAAWPRPWEP